MKRKIAWIMILALLLITLNGCTNKDSANTITELKVADTIEIPEEFNAVHGLYGDPSDSIADMNKSTNHIVYGEVESVEESSEVAVAVSLKVLESYKGTLEENKSIKIAQIGKVGGDEVLEEGKQYVLFLNSNNTEEPSYYIRAGVEGVFEVDLETEEIISHIEKFNKDLAKTFKVKDDDEVRIKLNKFKNLLKND